MKKLLLVLMVVAMASFLFVGCLPGVTPGEGEGEGEVEVPLCPTVGIGAVVVDGISYVKGEWYEDLEYTITFAELTEGVNVYIRGAYSAGTPGVGTLGISLILFPDADKKVYSGTIPFSLLEEFFLGWYEYCTPYVISVVSCEGECICEYPFKVDWLAPEAGIVFELSGEDCCPPDETLTIKSAFFDDPAPCDPVDEYCCVEDCSGLASWKISLYSAVPFDECCDPIIPEDDPCVEPEDILIKECEGTDCEAIECIIVCDDFTGYDAASPIYVVFTLEDNVGHTTEYYGTVYRDTAESVVVTEFTECDFSDTGTVNTNDILGYDCL